MFNSFRTMCVLIFGVGFVCCESTTNGNSTETDTGRSMDNNPSYFSNVYQLYKDCFANNAFDAYEECVSRQVVIMLDRVVRKPKIPLMEGLTLVENADSVRQGRDAGSLLTQDVLEATLPRSLDDRQNVLYNMLMRKVADLITSHSVQIKLPGVEEFRASKLRIKKMILPFLVGIVLKAGTFLPVVLSGMALLALKSLVASKTALAITTLLGLRKLFSSGNSGGVHVHHAEDHHDHHDHHDYHHKPQHVHELLAHSMPEYPVASHEALHGHYHGYGRALRLDVPSVTTHAPVVKKDVPTSTTDATTLQQPPSLVTVNNTQS